MEIPLRLKVHTQRVSKSLFISGIILGVGLLGYFFSTRFWQIPKEVWEKLPAEIFRPKEKIEEENKEEEFPIPQITLLNKEEKKYEEIAEKGEGITHLARKALKKYLQDHPQDFQITPEHKVYIEDYIAKKLGGGWLKLGEKVEISSELIREALERAKTLSQDQLQNLTQYSQLVPSLNY